MAKKIQLWEVQKEADERNFKYYQNLSAEDRKQIALYPLMSMLSITEGSSDLQQYYIMMVNELANTDFWKISKHPELQWKLLASCGIGFKVKHGWIPFGKRKSNTPKLDDLLFEINPHMNDEELEIVKSKLTKEELKEIIHGRGMLDKEGKIYTEEFKKLRK